MGFILGLVSVYDTHKFNQHLQANLAYRPHLRTLYASTNDETLSASPTSLPPCGYKKGS